MKIKYGIRDHRGGLTESLATTEFISEEEFKRLLPNYDYYGFDNRVNQLMFILHDISKYYKSYKVWLFIQIEVKYD